MLTNDTVPCGALAVLTVTSQPAHGTVVLNRNGGFQYTPSVPGQRLDDSFKYEINCNGQVGSHVAKCIAGVC